MALTNVCAQYFKGLMLLILGMGELLITGKIRGCSQWKQIPLNIVGDFTSWCLTENSVNGLGKEVQIKTWINLASAFRRDSSVCVGVMRLTHQKSFHDCLLSKWLSAAVPDLTDLMKPAWFLQRAWITQLINLCVCLQNTTQSGAKKKKS